MAVPLDAGSRRQTVMGRIGKSDEETICAFFDCNEDLVGSRLSI